jgi:hypothetical protein
MEIASGCRTDRDAQRAARNCGLAHTQQRIVRHQPKFLTRGSRFLTQKGCVAPGGQSVTRIVWKYVTDTDSGVLCYFHIRPVLASPQLKINIETRAVFPDPDTIQLIAPKMMSNSQKLKGNIRDRSEF